MWQHSCGWYGSVSDLVLEHIDGILCSASCPQCGGEWPFLFEDDEEIEEEPKDYPRLRKF